MLTDSDESFSLTLMSGSVFKNSGFTSNVISNPTSLLNPFFSQTTSSDFLFESSSNQLINAWFGSEVTDFINTQQLDLITIGLLYKSTDMSFSLNHRLRGTSVSQVSRGWYDSTFNAQDGTYLFIRNLSQYSNFRHEIALGFAWEQGLLSGLIGSRSAIYVGVNPKLILPVEYFDGRYTSISKFDSLEDTQVQRSHSLSLTAFNKGCSSSANPFTCTTTDPNWSSISGFGAGFDAGITWRLSFGNSIRLREDLRPVSDFQISLSLAVNDIGFISQRNSTTKEVDNFEYMAAKNSIISINQEYLFTPKSYFDFIGSDLQGTSEFGTSESKSVTFLTPTTLTAGIGLELNKIRLGMEYQQQTGNQKAIADFSSIHFGNQINLIPNFSIRSGFIIQSDEPIIYTAGLGIDTSWLSISASAMAKQLSTNDDFRPIMMNVGTLSLKF